MLLGANFLMGVIGMSDFKNKTVYEIYVKSFCDSNGDGIGDLPGITSKLDYLEKLGVDYLWLTPFYNSPQHDNGYDISDYTSVNPLFGSMRDFDALVQAAKDRGIGIMLDMVFNHSSTEHDWFQRALAGDPEYQAYYYFIDGDPEKAPTNWESKFGGSAWQYVPSLKKWYLHLFDPTQADLNWSNPKVREELKNVIRFWKNKGVKGFRFDVINLISKPDNFIDDWDGDGSRFYTDGPRVNEYLQELVHDTGIEDMITVGEMAATKIPACIQYTRPENKELAMAFSFHHLKVDYRNGDKWSLQKPDIPKLKSIIRSWQEGMQEGNGWQAFFWENHDQPRSVSRFGKDQGLWKESAKMLATVLMTLRSTPYIYQGQEIGTPNPHFTKLEQYKDVESSNYYAIMLQQGKTPEEALQVLAERSRDNGRTPMQWSNQMNAGFSEGDPWIEQGDSYHIVNVSNEIEDPDSIFYYYKKMIRLRMDNKSISEGSFEWIESNYDDVIAFARVYENKRIVIVANFSDQEFDLRALEASENIPAKNCLADSYSGRRESGKLRPFEAYVAE